MSKRTDEFRNEEAFRRYRDASRAAWDIRDREREARREMEARLQSEARRLRKIAMRAAEREEENCPVTAIDARGYAYVDHGEWIMLPAVNISAGSGQTTLASVILLGDKNENDDTARQFGRAWARLQPIRDRYAEGYDAGKAAARAGKEKPNGRE